MGMPSGGSGKAPVGRSASIISRHHRNHHFEQQHASAGSPGGVQRLPAAAAEPAFDDDEWPALPSQRPSARQSESRAVEISTARTQAAVAVAAVAAAARSTAAATAATGPSRTRAVAGATTAAATLNQMQRPGGGGNASNNDKNPTGWGPSGRTQPDHSPSLQQQQPETQSQLKNLISPSCAPRQREGRLQQAGTSRTAQPSDSSGGGGGDMPLPAGNVAANRPPRPKPPPVASKMEVTTMQPAAAALPPPRVPSSNGAVTTGLSRRDGSGSSETVVTTRRGGGGGGGGGGGRSDVIIRINGGDGSPGARDKNRSSDGGGGGRMMSRGHSFSQPNSVDCIPLVLPAFEDVLLSKSGSGSGSGTKYCPASGSGPSDSCGGGLVQPKVMMKHIRVKDTVVVIEYVSTSPEETNRLIMAYGADPFAVVHFEVRFGSQKETREYIDKVLRAGVRIGSHTYNFLGHSNEQLKTRTCVLFRTDSPKQIEKLLASWIDYTGIASVAKRAKRTALLFSRFRPVPLPEHLRRHEDIEDLLVPGGDAKYTDGCGYCSVEFARYLSRYLDVRHRGRRYVPSMFQIRYLGYKGVVAVQPGLDERNARTRDDQHKVHMQLRKSMCKFKIPKEQHEAAPAEASAASSARLVFGVCGYSKPYKYGYLNSQAVMLLSALGVPDAVLEARQDTYLEELVRLHEGGDVAVRHLLAADKVEEAELLAAGYGDDLAGGRTEPLLGALQGLIDSREGREKPRVSQVLKTLQREEVDKLVKELPPRQPKQQRQQQQEQAEDDLAPAGPSKQLAPPPPYLLQQQQQHLRHKVNGDQQSARDDGGRRTAEANAPRTVMSSGGGGGGRSGDRRGQGGTAAESSRSGNSSGRGAGNGPTTSGGGEQMRGPYVVDNDEGGDAREGPLQDAEWDSLTAADFGPDCLAAAAAAAAAEETTHRSSGGRSPLDPLLYGADTMAAPAAAAAPNGSSAGVTATVTEKRISPKIRVRLEQSRRVFGVADPSREWPVPPSDEHNGPRTPQPQLFYGQCFFQPLVDGQAQSLVGGHVLMIRNPCYDIGDVRVLEVVDVPSCRHLEDVLVLPVDGPRPTADESSGGDLDGDTFLVIWDPDFVRAVPRLPSPPYTAAPERQAGEVGMQHLISYFSGYRGELLGRIDRLYHLWAAIHPEGPRCSECRALSQLFCRGVDSVSTGQATTIPPHLQLPPESELSPVERQRLADRVWKRMERRSEELWRAFHDVRAAGLLEDPEGVRDLDSRGLMRLVRSKDIGITEFELLRLMVRWCAARPGADLMEWAMHIDFGSFSPEQRLFALSAGLPRYLVFNALGQSALLQSEDLHAYQLGGERDLHWKMMAEGTMDNPLAFDHFHKALTAFQRKLLLMQMAEPSQVIAMYLNERFPMPGTYKCGQDMLVFAFAGSFRHKHPLPSHNLWLDLTSNRIQIYRNGNTSQSFLWLHKGPAPLRPQAPVALTAPDAEMRPKVGLLNRNADYSNPNLVANPNEHNYQQQRRAYNNDRNNGTMERLLPAAGPGGSGLATGRVVVGAAGARGSGARGGTSGGDPHVRVSIATIDLDRRAFNTGQLRKVTKEPLLRYELYVVSDREPLNAQSIWHLGGTEPYTPNDDGSEGTANQGEEAGRGFPLPPVEVPALPEELLQLGHLEARACNGGAVEIRLAALAARLAGQGKLAPAMRAARLARHVLQSDQLTDLLRAAGRLHDVGAAGQLVGWMLERREDGGRGGGTAAAGAGASGADDAASAAAAAHTPTRIQRALRVLREAAGTGVLVTCPEVITRIWAQIRAVQDAAAATAAATATAGGGETPVTSPHTAAAGGGGVRAPVPLSARDLELLLLAAVSCARRQPEFADDLIADIRSRVTLAGGSSSDCQRPPEPRSRRTDLMDHAPLRLRLQLLKAVTLIAASGGVDYAAAVRICRGVLEQEDQEGAEGEEQQSSDVRGGDGMSRRSGSSSNRSSGGTGYIERYCITMAAALSYEVLTEVAEADAALAARAEGERWCGGGGGGAAPPPEDYRPGPLLFDFIATKVASADSHSPMRSRLNRVGGGGGGGGAGASLQDVARRWVAEMKLRDHYHQFRQGLDPDGLGAVASAQAVLELRNLVACTGPESRPQPLDPDSAIAAEGAGDNGGGGGGGGGGGSGEYDEIMVSRTTEGHDAYVASRGLCTEGLGLTAAGGGGSGGGGGGGGGGDGFSLELRRQDGLLIPTGGGNESSGLRVGDLVRLSDMRTPSELLHRYLRGGCDAAGMPLAVEAVVTSVGTATLTLDLPWQPDLYEANVSAADGDVGGGSGGGGGGGGGGAGQGEFTEGASRRLRSWRLQRLGNVVTYERGTQALLRCQQQLVTTAHPLFTAANIDLGVRRYVATPLEIVVRTWAGEQLNFAIPQTGLNGGGGDGGSGGGSGGVGGGGDILGGMLEHRCGGSANAVVAASASASAAAAAASRVAAVAPEAVAAACRAAGSNASQRSAVEAAASRVLSIIHGPPGTGKTTTIAAILMTLLLNQDQQQAGDASCAPIPRQRQQPILVTAETNVAVDNILDRLLRLVNDEKKKKQEGQRPQETRMVGETTAENADAATGAATAAATVPSLARAAASAAGGEGGERVDGSLGDVNRKLLKLQQTEIEDQLCGSRSSEEGMDCLLEGLGRKAGEVVRVGDSGSVSPHLRKYCLEAIQGVRTEFGYNSRAVRKILKGARLVFATCAGAGSPLLDGVDFPLVVVDEASQATEPTTLIPLTRGSRQAVLVGDHLQLGPMLRSREARAVGAGVPLFERLQHRASPLQPQPPGGGLEAGDSRQREPGLHPSNGGGGGGFGGGLESHMLDTQYRMHPEIAAFPAQHFYGGRLRNGANTPGIPLPAPLTRRVTFVHVEGWERGVGQSFENLAQEEEACRWVHELLHHNRGSLEARDIGIITPYRQMVNRLKHRLSKTHPSLEVATVDGFQGREKRVILLVTVRANRRERNGMGFVKDARRLNVAITRAAAALVVLGHEPTMLGRQAAGSVGSGLVMEGATAPGSSSGSPSMAGTGACVGVGQGKGDEGEQLLAIWLASMTALPDGEKEGRRPPP
ncbi:hypothetical protein Vretifemale_12713 [Volvox reticuliferus]|uniref:AAA+ ATPase domain-containing protein n=1 Tax=Volvox reticuliferus TaxID=1737510 RepID=A0A8J4FTS9_9CHLO|nr:hypothetical protein Vretifemale_12713 [Volvox reticuliferus]